MLDLGTILSGVASARFNLIEKLKFAENVELTVHLHLGNELYPSAMIQIQEPNSKDKNAPKTFVLDDVDNEGNKSPDEPTDLKTRELPFNIGNHIVLDEKFFSNPIEDNFQHSNTVQFVPAYEGKALASFMDCSGRTFFLVKGSNVSFYIDLPKKDHGREKYHIKNKKFTVTGNSDISWEFLRINAGEFIKIPDDNLAIVSFDETAIAFALLISRIRAFDQTQHWIVAFPI